MANQDDYETEVLENNRNLAPAGQNPIVPTSGKLGATVEGAMTRQAAEVQAAMVVAKNFPRDETQALKKIINSCKRVGLAETAFYKYKRGSTEITGPSIRMAEALAQSWGNLDFGIIELHQAAPDGSKPGESQVMAFCWDLESNTRQTKIFTVPHFRATKQGGYNLTDPRDIYELVGNNGARRLRKCILGIIPGDIIDRAVLECEKTLAGNNAPPLIDDVRQLVITFASAGVSQAMIEKRIGHKIEECNRAEYNDLRTVYKTLYDGMGKREDFFTLSPAEAAAEKGRSEALQEKLKNNREEREAKRNGNGAAASEAPAAGLFNPEQETTADKFARLCKEKGFKETGILKEYRVKKFGELPQEKQDEIIKMIENEPAGE